MWMKIRYLYVKLIREKLPMSLYFWILISAGGVLHDYVNVGTCWKQQKFVGLRFGELTLVHFICQKFNFPIPVAAF